MTNAGELHLVHTIFKTLDADGVTRLHVWSGEVRAVDAGQALRSVLGSMLAELPPDEPAPVQVFEIVEAQAVLVDSELREQLEAKREDQ